MTEKAKRTGLIIAGILLCAALVIGIAGRFTSAPTTEDPTISDNGPDTKDPLVNIDTPDVKVEIKTDTSSDKNDPGKAADSSGTEQAIQGTPTKPDAPEKPKAPGQVADDHKAEDVPNSERKTEDEPHPTYPEQPTSKPAESQPAAGSTNSSGQVYVPGFGYVDSSGDNTVIDGQDIYENGNKIGEMGGGN